MPRKPSTPVPLLRGLLCTSAPNPTCTPPRPCSAHFTTAMPIAVYISPFRIGLMLSNIVSKSSMAASSCALIEEQVRLANLQCSALPARRGINSCSGACSGPEGLHKSTWEILAESGAAGVLLVPGMLSRKLFTTSEISLTDLSTPKPILIWTCSNHQSLTLIQSSLTMVKCSGLGSVPQGTQRWHPRSQIVAPVVGASGCGPFRGHPTVIMVKGHSAGHREGPQWGDLSICAMSAPSSGTPLSTMQM